MDGNAFRVVRNGRKCRLDRNKVRVTYAKSKCLAERLRGGIRP